MPRLPGCKHLFALCSALLFPFLSPAQAQDTLITNVLLIDGTGGPPTTGALRIAGDRIAAVGDLAIGADDIVHDGNGLVLAPGFIDTHSHHDSGLHEDPAATEAITQGITTIVVGQDGTSQHPLADFFARREATPTTVNLASFSGHNILRSLSVGPASAPADPASLERMKRMLQADLDAGALGLSTGLEYEPGIYSDTDEVLALAKVAAAAGGRYFSHMRSEDADFYNALRELIFIGRRAGIPVHISHMKLASRSLWGTAGQVLQVLDQARAVGIDVTADIYPYTFWQSTLQVLFPERDFTDRAAARFALTELTTPEGMRLTRYDADGALVGKTIAEIAISRNEDPADTYLWLISRSMNAPQALRGESVMGESMTERDIQVLMRWPHMNFGSDGALKGAHPRGAGTFPRVLSRYVKELDVMALETAVRKATQLAALHSGIAKRGSLRPGYYADLVLFDPATVRDRATVDDPHAVSDGIAAVWVNGELVLQDGNISAARPGRVLRRQDAY
jgi:N-acyl-D-amino-acid deacylase